MEAGEGAECLAGAAAAAAAESASLKEAGKRDEATATIPTTTDDARLPGGLLFPGWLSVFWIFLSEIGTSMPSSVRRLGLLDL